jgi:hypothetical protein
VLIYFVGVANPDAAAALSQRIDGMFANSPSPTQTMNERDSLRANLERLGNINVGEQRRLERIAADEGAEADGAQRLLRA